MTVSDFGMGRRYARHVVGDAEALEFALLVELVDRLQGHLVRGAAIWPVEVPHVERAAPATCQQEDIEEGQEKSHTQSGATGVICPGASAGPTRARNERPEHVTPQNRKISPRASERQACLSRYGGSLSMPAPEQEHSGVRPSTERSRTAGKTHDADTRVQLRVHREPALLPVDLAQVLFARAVGVAARSVDLPGEHNQTCPGVRIQRRRPRSGRAPGRCRGSLRCL